MERKIICQECLAETRCTCICDKRDKKKIFRDFLEKYGCKEKYQTNFKKEWRWISNGPTLSFFLDDTPIYLWVRRAFSWAYSNEGNKLWQFINEEWLHYIDTEEL